MTQAIGNPSLVASTELAEGRPNLKEYYGAVYFEVASDYARPGAGVLEIAKLIPKGEFGIVYTGFLPIPITMEHYQESLTVVAATLPGQTLAQVEVKLAASMLRGMPELLRLPVEQVRAGLSVPDWEKGEVRPISDDELGLYAEAWVVLNPKNETVRAIFPGIDVRQGELERMSVESELAL